VFNWPHGTWWFYEQARRIVQSAGLEVEKRRFGLFHRLRRTTITLLWRQSPAIAQWVAGHASAQTTLAHYVDTGGEVFDMGSWLPCVLSNKEEAKQ